MKLTYETIDAYLKENVSTNPLGHTSSNIDRNDFEEIGDLYDNSYGYLSYLKVRTKADNEVIIGSYPLCNSKVLKCIKSGQIVFFWWNDAWVAPLPTYTLADYTKTYLSEPAVRGVSILKDLYKDFIAEFKLFDQDRFKNLDRQSPITIEDKTATYLFNYKETHVDKTYVHFDIVSSRANLRAFHKWLQDHK